MFPCQDGESTVKQILVKLRIVLLLYIMLAKVGPTAPHDSSDLSARSLPNNNSWTASADNLSLKKIPK